MRNLAAEYTSGAPEVMSFFERAPRNVFTTRSRASRWDPLLAETIRECQERLGGRALFLGDEALVVTGQQPGLFTGPLYTIYKAATAVILAQKLQARFGVPHVPVFWVASDDHDFEEARTAAFLTRNHELLTARYTPAKPVNGLSMYRVPIEQSLHELVDTVADHTFGSEFRESVTAFLHESLDAAESLADWSARLLARLFRDTPLVVFSPHLAAARLLAVPILKKEIENPLASTRLVNQAGAQLFELGFPQQIEKADNECNFFLEVDGKRRKVLFEQERYRLPEEGLKYSVEEMLTLLRDSPERFSPNVALRCVVQQHLFPAAAYVAGPGEVAYWAQLKGLFKHFGLEMPVVYPRARCTLVTLKLKKLMAELGLASGDLGAPPGDLADRALAAIGPSPVLEMFRRRCGEVRDVLDTMGAELASSSPTAAEMSKKLETRVGAELGRIERAILKADESKTETVRKQVERICNTLAPQRKPQERVYNVFSFVFEHGWGLIGRLLGALDIESFEMNEVEL